MKDMAEMSAPPLGVKPAYLVAEDRITELCEAVVRMVEGKNYKLAKRYAREIYYQCDLMNQIESEEASR